MYHYKLNSIYRHTDCTELNLGLVQKKSRCGDAVLSFSTLWNVCTTEQLGLGLP